MSDNPEVPEGEPAEFAEKTNGDREAEILGWFSKISPENLSNPDKEARIRDVHYDKLRTALYRIGESEKQVDVTYRRSEYEDTSYDNGRALLWLSEYVFPEEVGNDINQVLETDDITPESSSLQGLRVAEIGGNMMIALRHWGADVVSTYEEDIKEGKRRYVDSGNYRQIFGEEPYHITYSYAVFDMGGGVEKTLGFENHTTGENYTELMKAMSGITARGGLSIHYGHHILEAITEDYALRSQGEISDRAREVFR